MSLISQMANFRQSTFAKEELSLNMTPRKLVSGTGKGKETGQNTILLFEGATMVPMDTEDLSQRRPMTLIGQCVNMVENILS